MRRLGDSLPCYGDGLTRLPRSLSLYTKLKSSPTWRHGPLRSTTPPTQCSSRLTHYSTACCASLVCPPVLPSTTGTWRHSKPGDIAMLGVIHRAVLGVGPPHLRRFFRLAAPADYQRTRADVRRHHRHLEDPREGRYLEVLRRSALGLIGVYNLLPPDVVDAASVQSFQRLLQALVQRAEWTSVPNWHRVLSPRLEMASHPLPRLSSPSPTPSPTTRRRPPLAHAPPPTPT